MCTRAALLLLLSLSGLSGFTGLSGLKKADAAASNAAAVAAIAQYKGADRTQRLIDGAKKEGELLTYSSLEAGDLAALNNAFEKKYGIKVKTWRAASDSILQRTLQEAKAGRFDVDAIDASTPILEALHREKLLVPVQSPYLADMLPQTVPAHHEWVGSRLNVFVQAYNTKLVKKEDLPQSYYDLLAPKWKGKLSIEATDDDWFATLVQALGEKKGLQLFQDIKAGNGLSVRKGHTLLTKLVTTGEVPFALTVYNFTATQLRDSGAPLDWYAISPAIARANGLGITARAPHPHAALLYYDFIISDDGQQILRKRGFMPSSTKIATPFSKMPLKVVDPAQMLDDGDKWARLYDQIVVKGK
ncbi:MAG TPA: extracellular solute-binding protein [Herbaspirillum sp.]|nr:extracellular solute-binding protein [Herbaspirillum sp.]